MAYIGQIIEEKYEILREVGKGGMSIVYLAMDTRLNKQWAVKEIQKEARDKNNDIVIQSAIAEANMIKSLDHPSLPRIVNIIDEENVIYIIMDYIEGQDLEFYVKEGNPLPQDQVVEWAKQLCSTLDYLHTRKPPIIYRDMKPKNIMLKPDGNIVLIDFGIAREFKEKNVADTTSLGTIGYAAPEQFGGKGQTDPRTDIYCLGATLYHLLTGHNPADDGNVIYPIRKWIPTLSPGLENIILKCTQPEKENRYQSALELLYAIDHYEQEDDAFKHVLKKKIKLFTTTCILAFFFLIAGIGCTFGQSLLKKSNYDELISMAEKSSDPETQRKNYIQAITVLPERAEAYDKLINNYKNDISFSEDEALEFKDKVLGYLNKYIVNTEDYSDIAYEVGKLYWYYYDYGNFGNDLGINLTRMNAAINWFNSVEETNNHSKTAKIYYNIGKFHSDLQKAINEGSSVSGMYSKYFSDLQNIAYEATQSSEEEMVQLEMHRLIICSLETYARQFKKDGVQQEPMKEMLENSIVLVNEIETNSTKTEEIKKYILSRHEAINTVIQNAFIEEVVEGQ